MVSELVRVERRASQRFALNLPLAVRFQGRTFPAFTQDVCGHGIFFFCAEVALCEGAVVELTFTLPSEITLAESMPVRCRGHVLRTCGTEADGKNGFAVRLDSCQHLPCSPEGPAAELGRDADSGSTRQSPRVWPH